MCVRREEAKKKDDIFFTEPLAVSQTQPMLYFFSPTAFAELSCADIFTLHSSPLVAASPVSLSVDGNEVNVWFFNNTLKHMRASLPSAHSQIPAFTFQKQFLNDAIHAGWHILRLPRLARFIGDDGCGMCVYECTRCVERTSEGELPELLSELITKVASNDRTAEEKKKGSSPWIASALAGQFVTASNPPPAAPIRSARTRVCEGVCIFVGWMAKETRFACLMRACLTAVSHNNFDSEQIKAGGCGCVVTANTTLWTHSGLVWWKCSSGSSPSRLAKINSEPSGVLLCAVCLTAVRPLQRVDQITAC